MMSLPLFPIPLGLCLLAVPVSPARAAPATIVVFGDSTTAEDPAHPVYGRLLGAALNAPAPGAVRVVNAGVRGNTTAMAAKRFATDVLWYLYHENVSVQRDPDGEWTVYFESRCKNLQDDLLCGVYEQRPVVCRDFDNRTCEVNAPGGARGYEILDVRFG